MSKEEEKNENRKRDKGVYNPNYYDYVEMIVNDSAYKGLFYDRDKDGNVNWVVTGKSLNGIKRQKWWDNKCKELGIPIQKGCYAKVARQIHPTGKHVCQCCGEERSIFYEYPSKNTVVTLNKILGTSIDKDNDEERAECTIREIIEGWCNTDKKVKEIAKAFKLSSTPTNKKELIKLIDEELIKKENSRLSPGVMSNPPDRFDGFHSYNLCCRTKFDKGRRTENMQTYAQDRRAYEDWAEGDFNLANRLMGEIRKQPPMRCPICNEMAKMSADHIGPISLGFCHSEFFAPLCKKCNSSKNNRFTEEDVKKLIQYEEQGHQVISWHSKYIWDLLKKDIKSDEDAKKASSVMLKCHQNVIHILSLIYKQVGKEFLMSYLHPDYAMMDYRFENVDLKHLEKIKIEKKEVDNKNKRSNKERYIRISFESLEKFDEKDNRKNEFYVDNSTPKFKEIITAIKEGLFDHADTLLKELIQDVANEIVTKEYGSKAYKILDESHYYNAAEPKQ